MAATTLPGLVKQLDEFQESIRLYENIIYKSGSERKNNTGESPSSNIPPPKSSVQSIVDVALLSKAHTTKVGIAFKPPISVAAASKTLADSSALIPALVGAFVSIYDDRERANKVGILLLREVKDQVLDFLSAHKGLCVELKALSSASAEKGNSTDEVSGSRLVSVGKVWETCDTLAAITKLRSAKILAAKVDQFAEMVQDAIYDLDEFIENGNQDSNSDDFILDFGSEDEDDDIVDKLKSAGRTTKKESSKDEEEEDEDDEDDHDENSEPSPLQVLALKLKPHLAALPDYFQNVIIPQANKNPQDVMFHYKIYESLTALTINIDDLVAEYINDEAEESEINESHLSIKKEIKALTYLITSAKVQDSELELLTTDFVNKLNVL